MLAPAEVQRLLNKLCVDLGFCLPSQEQEKLQTDPPADPVAFTNAVFVAEGLKPELAERRLYRAVYGTIVDFCRQHGYDVGDTVPNNRRCE